MVVAGPCLRSGLSRSRLARHGRPRLPSAWFLPRYAAARVRAQQAGQLLGKTLRSSAESRTRSCGRRGPATLGSTVERSRRRRLRVLRFGRIRSMEPTLLLRICLNQVDRLWFTPRQAQIAQRLRIDREDTAGRAVLRRHVADGGAVGQAELAHPRAGKTRQTYPPHPACAASR